MGRGRGKGCRRDVVSSTGVTGTRSGVSDRVSSRFTRKDVEGFPSFASLPGPLRPLPTTGIRTRSWGFSPLGGSRHGRSPDPLGQSVPTLVIRNLLTHSCPTPSDLLTSSFEKSGEGRPEDGRDPVLETVLTSVHGTPPRPDPLSSSLSPPDRTKGVEETLRLRILRT